MTHRQQNHPVATHLPGGLSVYVARWPQRPGLNDQPKPPQDARAFGVALVEAADEIECEVP